MVKTGGPINSDRLKSFIERIEKLEEERKAIGGDIRDVYSEAKGVGYDVGTMRWVVRERKVDAAARDERDSLRDTYAHALGMAVEAVRNGMTYREAEEEFGFSKSAIHRASHQTRDNASGTAARDMVADNIGNPDAVREMTADDLGDPLLVIDKGRAAFREKIRRAAANIRTETFRQSVMQSAPVSDDLTIPCFLDQRKPVPA